MSQTRTKAQDLHDETLGSLCGGLEEDLPGADRNLIMRLKARPGYGRTFVSIDVYAFALRGTGQTDADFEQFLQERAERATP